MKLEQVLNFGMSPNPNANISYAEAKATQAFLANIQELGVQQLGVMVMQGAPSQWVKVPIAEVEGVIPETAVLEFYVWLEGIPDNANTHYHNVKAIHSCLTQNPNIVVGLTRFLGQFTGDTYMMGTAFAKNAVTDAVVKIWNDAHGIAEPGPVDPPVVIPGNNDPAMPDKEGPMGAKTFFPGVFELEPGDTNPVGFIYVAPDGKKYERLATTWREVR